MLPAHRLEVVSNTLPEPPYPHDIRARGWRFEIDLERVMQSTTWKRAPADLRPWLLMLWAQAWHQWPVGTLDTDDIDIAATIGMPLTMFQTHREILMRGWIKHSDDRLYHSVITERVVEMIGKRAKDRTRVADWRDKKKQEVADDVTRNTDVRTCELHVSTTPEPEPEPVLEPKGQKQGARKRSFALPEWVPAVDWQDFVAYRTKVKKPLTERAMQMAIDKLSALRDGGNDPGAVLRQSVFKGWTDLYELKGARGADQLGEHGRRTADAAQRWIDREETKDETDGS